MCLNIIKYYKMAHVHQTCQKVLSHLRAWFSLIGMQLDGKNLQVDGKNKWIDGGMNE